LDDIFFKVIKQGKITTDFDEIVDNSYILQKEKIYDNNNNMNYSLHFWTNFKKKFRYNKKD